MGNKACNEWGTQPKYLSVSVGISVDCMQLVANVCLEKTAHWPRFLYPMLKIYYLQTPEAKTLICQLAKAIIHVDFCDSFFRIHLPRYGSITRAIIRLI